MCACHPPPAPFLLLRNSILKGRKETIRAQVDEECGWGLRFRPSSCVSWDRHDVCKKIYIGEAGRCICFLSCRGINHSGGQASPPRSTVLTCVGGTAHSQLPPRRAAVGGREEGVYRGCWAVCWIDKVKVGGEEVGGGRRVGLATTPGAWLVKRGTRGGGEGDC